MFRLPPTRPQRFILPRKLQSRYRRHLFTLNLFSNHPRETISSSTFSFHYSPRTRISHQFEFNLGRMCVKQISSFFTIKSHKESLFPIIWLFCCVSLVVIAPVVTYVSRQNQLLFFFFFSSLFVLFFVKEEKMPFFWRNLECNFTFQNCELYYSKISRDDANHHVLATRTRHTQKKWTFIVSYGGAKYRSPYLSKARQRFFTSL